MTRITTLLWMLVVVVAIGASTSSAPAAMITVDEILFEGDVGNGAILTGTVNMTLSGSTLTIVLTNTSGTATPDGGSTNLLAGLGFNLPTGVTIASGTASMTGSAAVNFTAPADGNIGGEWGYANDPIDNGHFDGSPSTLGYTTVVSVQTNDVDNLFGGPDLGPPPNGIDGPDFGLLSADPDVSTSDAGGVEAIRASATLVIQLAGTLPADLLAYIEANPVALAFGSPDQSDLDIPITETAPEPGSLTLLVLGTFGALGVGRRRRRNSVTA